MRTYFINNVKKGKQYLVSVILVITIAVICYSLTPFIGYQVVALILLVTVSLVAVSFDIFPVLLAAALSAFIWDFFFIPPHFTLHVNSANDTVLLIMYFVIAMVNAVLTYKIRQVEKIARHREEKANTIKLYNTLLNSLSHELRTPISTIIAATDNIQANNTNLTVADKNRLITEISKASFRLNQQVENLLNISRIESGFIKPKKDWCDITEIIYAIVKRIREDEIGQGIVIEINDNIPLLKSDKGMLEQILYNLVSNAVLYTEPACSILIKVFCNTDGLHMVIEDNGSGFPEDEMDKVFNKFYRLKNARTGGTGLGLSIVKGFTEALGGNVHLKNIAKGGAQFSVVIPAETSYIHLNE